MGTLHCISYYYLMCACSMYHCCFSTFIRLGVSVHCLRDTAITTKDKAFYADCEITTISFNARSISVLEAIQPMPCWRLEVRKTNCNTF